MNQTVETVFPDIAIPSPTYSVAQAPDKDIYIGTESNGLYIYSENWKLKKHVPIDGIIATILPDNNGDIWLGLDETGICLFNKNKHTFTWITPTSITTRYAHSFPTATVPFWSEHSGD